MLVSWVWAIVFTKMLGQRDEVVAIAYAGSCRDDFEYTRGSPECIISPMRSTDERQELIEDAFELHVQMCLQRGRYAASEPFLLGMMRPIHLCRYNPDKGLDCAFDPDPELCAQRAEAACEILLWFGTVGASVVHRLRYLLHAERTKLVKGRGPRIDRACLLRRSDHI